MYIWSVAVPGMDGPQNLTAWVNTRTRGARQFASLSDLVKAADPVNCKGGMIPDCDDRNLTATGSGDVVTLVLRDSAQIARLFGMRPTFVQASETRPDGDRRSSDSVRVEYVAPLIPEPDAALRADAARSRRRFEASINRIARIIEGGSSGRGLWLAVGDSVSLRVNESHCTYDMCVEAYPRQIADSGWSVDDSRIARLQMPVPDRGSDRRSYSQPMRYLKALRPGVTYVRVRGIHGPSDTAASSPPPARAIQRVVRVTRPIGRVEVTRPPDSVFVNRILYLNARTFDIEGHSVADVPVTFEVEGEGSIYRSWSEVPAPVTIRTRGRKRIMARAGQCADTLTVTAVDSLDQRR
jgi:hypothetical protein